MKFAAAVLAAGGSSRMGTPKQLLVIDGESLVQRAARLALQSGADPVLVIVGAASGAVTDAVRALPVRIVVNERWESGIASSIHSAVGHCGKAEALLILLCDQPDVTAAHLRQLAAAAEGGAEIAAASYEGTLGVPALFRANVYPELLRLKGDSGAKRVILAQPERVIAVPMEVASRDLDTREDAIRSGADPAGRQG
jgi:molybdenum cofactor cytidylyltransferase